MRSASNLRLAVLLLSLLASPSWAQPRDGVMNEIRNDESSSTTCDEDTQCVALRKRQEERSRELQRAYELKPWYEKAFPWLVLAGLGWAMWAWVGRSGHKRGPPQR